MIFKKGKLEMCCINRQQCYRTRDRSLCNRCLLRQIFLINYLSGSSPLKDAQPYSLFSYLFTVVGATFNYSATIWSLARGLIVTFAGNKQRCRYNGQWSWRCGDMGEIYDTGGAVRWEIVPSGGWDRCDWERDWGRKMGCGNGEAPGEHKQNQEEEQLKCFLLTEGK